MLISDVAKLEPVERFLYWIKERHMIYRRRKAGKPAPWTDDEVLQSFFFTNPYRENDKVTVWFRENVREPLRNDPRVLFATVAFRWFNLPRTGDILTEGAEWNNPANLLTNWDPKEALDRLSTVRARGEKVFTGAYMINSPGGRPKLEAIIERVDNVWKDRERLIKDVSPEHPTRNDPGASCSLEAVHRRLLKYDGMGGFMAYEVVTDLRHTYLLENAPDKMSWANPGPGCSRGLCRILGIPFDKSNNSSSPPFPKNGMTVMRDLLSIVNTRLLFMPPFEMREIEHSLCEADKYERALFREGKLKRKYNGV